MRIIQTNSARAITFTRSIPRRTSVGVINGIEVNHGATVASDASVYISNEADNTLDFVDAKTLQVNSGASWSGHPNNLAVSRDGRRVHRHQEPEPGADVNIGVVHDGQDAPDAGRHPQCLRDSGRQVCGGRLDFGETINVFDAQTETAWTLKMDLASGR